MRIKRSYLNWGVFLVFVGAVPLVVELGAVPTSATDAIVTLWPVVLIGMGLGIMLRFTPFQLLGGLVVASVGGLVIGSLIAGGVRGVASVCVPGEVTGPTETRTGAFAPGAARLEIDVACSDLTVDRIPGPEWRVDTQGGADAPLVSAEANQLRVTAGQSGPFDTSGQAISVNLPESNALTVQLEMSASRGAIDAGGELERFDGTFNGSDAQLDMSSSVGTPALDATLNASSVSIRLPDGSLNGDISVNASSLTVCTPPEVALSISYSGTLASENFAAAGLAGDDQTWQTQNYSEATNRIALHISSHVSSVELDRSGGCR